MTPSDTKALLAMCVAIIGFLLAREFKGKDKTAEDLQSFKASVGQMVENLTRQFADELRRVTERNTAAIEALNKAVAELTLAMSEQKIWLSEQYVKAEDHRREMADMHAAIASGCQRAERDLEKHIEQCPLKVVANGKI